LRETGDHQASKFDCTYEIASRSSLAMTNRMFHVKQKRSAGKNPGRPFLYVSRETMVGQRSIFCIVLLLLDGILFMWKKKCDGSNETQYLGQHVKRDGYWV